MVSPPRLALSVVLPQRGGTRAHMRSVSRIAPSTPLRRALLSPASTTVRAHIFRVLYRLSALPPAISRTVSISAGGSLLFSLFIPAAWVINPAQPSDRMEYSAGPHTTRYHTSRGLNGTE